MTGYYLEIGYIGGYSYALGPVAAWEELKAAVTDLRHRPLMIVSETRRIEPHWQESELIDYALRYSQDEDATLKIHENEPSVSEPGETVSYISQLAGGDRREKEAVRRAFCRLVIEAMHRKGIEVNLSVS